jgi:acetyltransferase-like isoleucine patch superfamily enzyme
MPKKLRGSKKKSTSTAKAKSKVPNLISPAARLGENVRVWNFAYVGADTTIGDNTKIGSLAHVDYNVVIGKNCKIEGLAYIAPLSRLGDNVFIGPSAVLTNDPYPLSDKMIGVKVGDGAMICAGAVVKAGVTVGRNSVVGMGAIVTKDVPPDSVVVGVPAKVAYTREEYEKKRLAWNNMK